MSREIVEPIEQQKPYGESPYGFGFSPELQPEVDSLLRYLGRTGRPIKWRGEEIDPLCIDVERSRRIGRDVEINGETAWRDNAELEERKCQVLTFSIEDPYRDKIGELQVTINPTKAILMIKDGEGKKSRKPLGEPILQSLPGGKRKLTTAAQAIREDVGQWLEVVEDSPVVRPEDFKETTEFTLLTMDDIFKHFKRNLWPELGERVQQWFAQTRSPEQKAVARALLTMWVKDGSGRKAVESFLASPELPREGSIRFFPSSVLEVVLQEEAIKVLAQIERGNISDPLIRILQGDQIKIKRFHEENPYFPETDVFRLPRNLQEHVRLTEDGSLCIDLTTIGKSKLGLVLGSAETALDLLKRLTGEDLNLKLTQSKSVEIAKEALRTSAGLESYTQYLRKGEGSFDFYRETVRQQIDVWKNQGWAMATFIGPTGAGKTTLARTLALEFIKRQAYETQARAKRLIPPYDDVVVYRLEGKNPQQLLNAQRQFKDILAKRPGKVTMLVIENSHQVSFADIDPETNQQMLNLGDEIRGLFATGKRLGGIFQIGEFLPEGVDGAYINDHRYRLTIFEAPGEERLGLGIKAVDEELKIMTKGLCREILQESRGEVMVSEELRRKVGQGLAEAYHVLLMQERGFLEFLQTDEGKFFTTTKWSNLGQQLGIKVKDQIGRLLTGQQSEWFALDGEGLSLTGAGRQELSKTLRRALEDAMGTTGVVAETKVKKKKAPKIEREEPKERVPEKDSSVVEAEARRAEGKVPEKGVNTLNALKALESAVATTREAYERTLQAKEKEIKVLEEKYGKHLDLIASDGFFRLLEDPGYLTDRQGEPLQRAWVTISKEFATRGENVLASLVKMAGLGDKQTEELKTLLGIAGHLVKIDEANLEMVNAMTTILATQMEKIRKLLGNDNIAQIAKARGQISDALRPVPQPKIELIRELLQKLGSV